MSVETLVRRRVRTLDVAVGSGFLLAAVVLLWRLWVDPNGRYLVDGGQDQEQWQWFFAVTAHQVLGGHNPLFSTLLNHPLGVNLMANTAMFGLGVPLIPVTVLLGAGFTWAIVLTLGPAGSAFAWYWLFSRQLVASRAAAAVGAAFCGFAPAIISHANAHPNFVVLAVIPLLLLRRPPGRRTAVTLGLLLAYQVFLGEEIMLLAATGLAIFGVLHGPRDGLAFCRRYLPTLALAGAIALAITAIPLAWQFVGPQSYHRLVHGPAANDPAAFTAFSSRSLAGDPAQLRQMSMNPTEENAFFGWPLLIVALGITIALWRRRPVRILAGLTIIAAWLSAGVPGPWTLIRHLPLYDSVIESRLALICVPAIGALLALGIDQLTRVDAGPVRRLGYAVIAAALLPIVPTPLIAQDRPETPAFFANGLWRQYVAAGRTVVPAPPPDPGNAVAMGWQVAAGFGFALPEGYFIGPRGPSGSGGYGADPRPTATVLRQVAAGGECALSEQQLHADLDYWKAGAVVLGTGQDDLKTCLDSLLGPAQLVGGVWVWPVGDR
jgi:dolichyl-phosphate beta-glucosyltransferase